MNMGQGSYKELVEKAGLKLGCEGKDLKRLERKEKVFQASVTIEELPEEVTLNRVLRGKEFEPLTR